MERLAAAKHGERVRLPFLLDPCRYVHEADQARQRGDHEAAVALIAQAYLAFDLCSAGCEHARGRGLSERNS
jgi:hypothetical protein